MKSISHCVPNWLHQDPITCPVNISWILALVLTAVIAHLEMAILDLFEMSVKNSCDFQYCENSFKM